MSRTKRVRKRKSRKKLAYGVFAVASILAFFLAYFSLRSSSPPDVAIVDQLSVFPEQRNQTFVDASKQILEEGGLAWAYHRGEEVTVDFYRNLPSYATSVIILRVHSAIMKTESGATSLLGLFTSENFSIEAAKNYRDDVLRDRLVEAFFSEEERAKNISYFGIVPKFIEESMRGKFRDTIIIMMGCEGIGYIDNKTGTPKDYYDMAEAFVNKGAKVYIGWNGPVGLGHTDQATVDLLQHLITRNQTIGTAVTETMGEVGKDPTYNSTLQYYPQTADAENHVIPNLQSSLAINVAFIQPIPETPKRPNARRTDGTVVLNMNMS